MKYRQKVILAAVLVLLPLLLAGCGKKGSLKPAWDATGDIRPMNVTDLGAEIRMGVVWLIWTVPLENVDKTRPANIDHYLVYYNILNLDDDYCLTCPLDFGNKTVLDPDDPGEAVIEGGRVEFPLGKFDPAKKYVSVVWTMSPKENSIGDSNVATLNWPVETKEN